MEKINLSSLLRDDKKIIFVLQSALQEQAAEEERLPVRQRHESLSWWVPEGLAETKKICLN